CQFDQSTRRLKC
nr:Chain E, L5Q meditope [synthetic construct]5TH2_F Chain F, L5Q meditope [synthetic construct]